MRANDFLSPRTEIAKKSTPTEAVLKIFRIRKKREITVETTQQFVISRPEAAVMTWCPACSADVSMVTAEEAAVMMGLNSRAIYRSVEGGQLHFAETSEGFLLICLKSLSACNPAKRLP